MKFFFETIEILIFINIYVFAQIDAPNDICGADDRVPSNNLAVGRIVLNYAQNKTATGFIIPNGKIITAGHIRNLIQGGDWLEFNVPSSNSNGDIQYAKTKDRYLINLNSIQYKYSDEGIDWMVFEVFPNSITGLTPLQAQKSFFTCNKGSNVSSIRLIGYGEASGTLNRTQQTSVGSYLSFQSPNFHKYNTDSKDGNSGSPVIDESTSLVIGVHTTGKCNTNGYNGGSGFYKDEFWNAMNVGEIISVNQKDESNNSLIGTNIFHFETRFAPNGFLSYSISTSSGIPFQFNKNSYETFRGSQDIYDSPYCKYNNWNNLDDVINHKQFLLDNTILNFSANFKQVYSGVNINNEYSEIPGFQPSNDSICFKDPWLIDYPDPLYGNQKRNRGMNAPFKERPSPFYPDINTSYNGDVYIGIFLNQGLVQGQWTPPYYSVRFKPQNLFISQTNRIHSFYLYEWTGSNVNFQSAKLNETALVFTSGTATVTAKLKGTNLSNYSNAYSNPSQRKFIQTPDGVKHICYESMGKVWYELSTNGGNTWLLGNDGKPLSSADAKNPSMSFYGNQVGIVWQEKNGSTFNIKLAIFYSANYASSTVGTLVSDDGQLYSYDANPVIEWGYNGKAVVIYSGLNLCNSLGGVALKYWYGDATSNGISQLSQCYINGTDENSINPTIAAIYSVYSNPFLYHVAWEQVINSTTSKINYSTLTQGANNYLSASAFQEASYNSGYTKNYKPSILLRKVNSECLPYITWLGYRTSPSVSSKVIMRYRQYGSWSPLNIYGGTEVASFSVNSAGFQSYQDLLGLGWSEPVSPGVPVYTNKAVKIGGSNNISTLTTTGRDLQINNSSSYNSMYVNSFLNSSLPYNFTLSQPFSSLSKENSANIFNGREGIIGKNSAQFFFALGDISVDGQSVNFINLPDSAVINSLFELNSNFQSEPFTVNSSSTLVYGVQYGITDSALCSSALLQNENIQFKIELLDAVTNQVLGIYDQVTYSSENIYQYNNIGYQVNMNGVGERTVKLRLVTNTNGQFNFSLANRFSDQSILAKTSRKLLYYKGSLAVTDYGLEQNYPNPFNPATIIKFQIPDDGFVTLKVYDMLGNEVATLVNEQKLAGKYEVNFNANTLASGVYIYKMQAGSFTNSKKMLLLK